MEEVIFIVIDSFLKIKLFKVLKIINLKMVNLNLHLVYVFAGYGFYTFVKNSIDYLITNRKTITRRYFYDEPEEPDEIIINDSSESDDDDELVVLRKRKRN